MMHVRVRATKSEHELTPLDPSSAEGISSRPESIEGSPAPRRYFASVNLPLMGEFTLKAPGK
jgi:hypothetical protein